MEAEYTLVAQNQNKLKRCTEVTQVTQVILSTARDHASNNSTQILFK